MNGKELKAIKKWYHENGMEYVAEDWGLTGETGESAGDQSAQPENFGREHKRANPVSHRGAGWWAEQVPFFAEQERTPEERRAMQRLEDFFAPYLAMLNRPQGDIVAQVMFDRQTFREIADDDSTTRQAAHQRYQTALRQLTYLIAQEDPAWSQERPRDFDLEQEAAARVLARYMKEEA